ncbi:protein FAM136A-like [Stomoxys calcitrans]|uniref:protein FAM136A-like n=1 Tax=Stomoxys calcitrans TaxID=35570 RepID=UPI0027E2C655|nr:protein FAM136A-like [Stomoxys calcitrans]
MQSNMHVCAAHCCDDYNRQPSMDHVQHCIEECSEPLLKAQDYMQHELGMFQGRLRNCLENCNNDIHCQIPSSTQVSDISEYGKRFEHCVGQCVDKHIDLIPKMMRAMKTVLANGPNVTDNV